jgi:VIT1/CCC1 family predicted Fe2+/Mn2+ transporter
MNNIVDEKLLSEVLRFQREEITGSLLYGKLAKKCRDEHNAAVLSDMAAAERRHYEFWKSISGQDVAPRRGLIILYTALGRLFGLTFALKLLEKGEEVGAADYARVAPFHPGAEKMGEEEENHEDALLGMIDEERLSYVGSIVLGLNDALVELTGTLAGLTFAFQKGKLVAVSGIITGIAAALSMAASNYLATKANDDPKAKKAALYTGGAYLITVMLLVLPYLIVPQTGFWIYVSLGITLLIAVGIIAGFNFYVSVAKGQEFKPRFLEMAGISLGVSFLSFLVGLLVRSVFGAE